MANSERTGWGWALFRLLALASCAAGLGLGAWSLLGDGGAWGFVGIVLWMSGVLLWVTSSPAALGSLHQPRIDQAEAGPHSSAEQILQSA